MNDAILKKIHRCMALADSSNPNEAANAMRQAQALMQKHNLDHKDLLITDIEDVRVNGTTKASPADWVQHLFGMVAGAFECRPFISTWRFKKCEFRLVGVAPAPELAAYTFDTLLRQLKAARQEYIRTRLTRYTTNKTRMANLFCEGWVRSVSRQCRNLNPDKKITEKIDAYFEKNEISLTENRERKGKDLSVSESGAILAGHKAAADVNLRAPIDGQELAQIGNGGTP